MQASTMAFESKINELNQTLVRITEYKIFVKWEKNQKV